MNPKLKFGITMMTASALMLSTATSFAGTTTSSQVIPESVLELMLAEGLITQAQMDAYLAKTEAASLVTLKSELQALVTAGTLTQTQADAAYAAIVADRESAKAESVKMAAMTTTELSAYLETLKDTSATSELDTLKTAGTLTTAQYNKIKALLNLDTEVETLGETATQVRTTKTTSTSSSAISTADAEATRLTQIKTQLSALVTKGTLTQTQADSVYAAIVSDQSTITAEREKIAAMTAAELTAYLEANKTATYVSALEALKTAGTITTAQYTAVQKILMTKSTVAGTTKAATTTNAKTTTATTSNKKTKPVTSIKTAAGKTTTVKTTAKTPVVVAESTDASTTFLTTVKTKLAAMVTKGTLTQVQADAAYTAIVADQAALAAEIESIEEMSIEELAVYMASQKTISRTSTLDALKTSGVLTSSQYNGIKAILTASQGFGTASSQTNFEEDEEMALPSEPAPPMQQTQRRQGK